MAHECDRRPLVEALFDDRLGAADRASAERHLTNCAECREELRALRVMRAGLRAPRADISPLDHQRARLALLRGATGAPARPTKRRPLTWIAAALVSLPIAAWATTATFASFRPALPAAVPLPSSATSAPSVTSASSSAVEAPTEEAPAVAAPGAATTIAIAAGVAPLARTATPENEPRAARSVEPRSVRTSARSVSSAVPSASSSHASRAFAEAMNALSDGDFGSGAGKLERFTSDHPTDVRAEEAVYLQAIALQRSGRVAEARAAARRYLALYPNGAHRTPAQRLAAE